MSHKSGKKKVVSGIHQASKTNAKPQPRVITAPEVVQVRRGTPLVLTEMGISATGVGTLYLAPDPGKNPKSGTYDTVIFAKSGDPLWITAKLPVQIVVLGADRTLTGTLTGAWTTGDTLKLPPAGLTLSAGPENYRIVAPPGGQFLKGGATPVIIEAPAVGEFSTARWEGSVTVAKGTPKITWTCEKPVVKGTVVGGPKLCARIEPATLAFAYDPKEGTQPDYGDITITASRKADNDYVEVSEPLAVTIVGAPGQFDNPLDLDTVPNKRATPDVGGLRTPELAKAFAKKTPQGVCNELNQIRGITATLREGRSNKVTMLDVVDGRPPRIKRQDSQRLTAIEFHQGGGIHGNTPYVRVSTTKGKIKIVQPGYDPHGENPIETIYIKGS